MEVVAIRDAAAEDEAEPGSAGPHALELLGPADLGRARRAVADHLARLDRTDLAPDAQLVASELVTNAFLHAGGAAALTVSSTGDGIRLEVRDGSPLPPVRLAAGRDAMTGRGLHLVEGIARRWGVEPHEGGKVVWAELGGGDGSTHVPPPLDEDALLAMWGDELDDEAPGQPAPIALGRVPTDLLLAAKGHVDNLVREFSLIASGAASGAGAEVPDAVTQLVDVVVHGFAEPRRTVKRLALTAAAAGEDHVELVLPVPADPEATIAAGEAYLEALEQADAYCRAARLLTLESLPQHRLFHRWYVGELLAALRARVDGRPYAPQQLESRLLAEIGVIAAAHRAADRAARLHALAVALSAAMTAESVAAAVLDEGVTALGASGGVVLLAGDSHRLRVPAAVGHDDDVMARLREEHPDAALPAAQAMRTGEAVWLESPDERDRRFPALIGFEPATVAMCAVPMLLGDRRLGALRFSFTEPRLFDAEERTFVTALAAQTAQALHRAELYRQRVEIAERLQATLLPARLQEIPGLEVAASYHPLTDALDVSGDFYDVWHIGPGRWAFAIGDVAGSGPEAAAITGLARHTLRALMSTELPMDQVLQRLHGALLDAQDRAGERFCTVVLGLLEMDGDTGATMIDLAAGGHPPPLLVRDDHAVEVLHIGGSLVGAVPEAVIGRLRLELEPGTTLLLMTDGATEARLVDDLLGVEGVVEAARGARGGARGLVQAVERAVRAHGGGRLRDDLALLAIRRPPEPADQA